jgi:ABC-type transport system involved in multi-copper enzyme maturation permease subunit
VNVHVAGGLARDAFHQVLDNSVFRILAVLALFPVLLTFVVGLHQDEISILFGAWTFPYDELFGTFGGAGIAGVPDPRGTVIEILLGVVFDFLAGSLGMLFALAATAFFVPRMLEKGAAEILFQRPVSRTALYLSRYLAGLIFVGLVSSLMVGGMSLGLWIVSGHRDLGILASALELTYVFGLVHAFSMLAGVVTRSTMGALLLAALFFFANGCIHNAWIAKETIGHQVQFARDQADEEREDAVPVEAPPPRGFKRLVLTTLDVLHLVLPKTSDAAVLSRKLRDELERGPFTDETSGVSLARLPARFRRSASAEKPGVPEALGQAILQLEGEDELAGVTATLLRRPVETRESRIGERTRTRTETTTQAARSLIEALDLDEETTVERLGFGRLPSGRELSGSALEQTSPSISRKAVVFRGVESRDMLTLLVEGPGAATPVAEAFDAVAANLTLDVPSPDDWYRDQFRIDAPLRFNILFSVGSSLLFAVALLALGAWRLARMDF